MTHTYAIVEVSPSVYDEVKATLIAAGYEHAIDDREGVIDLDGLALQSDPSLAKDSSEKILDAAAELKEAITDAKAKLLLELESTIKVGYQMRQAQKEYYSAKQGKQSLLVAAKRLEAAFDMRLADLRLLGVDLGDLPHFI
jgi:hypothetical protein